MSNPKQYAGIIPGKKNVQDVLEHLLRNCPEPMLNEIGEFNILIRYIPSNPYGYVDEFEQTIWKITRKDNV